MGFGPDTQVDFFFFVGADFLFWFKLSRLLINVGISLPVFFVILGVVSGMRWG
jgi:hypothetical protein